jgi:hypothetical protein
MLKVIAIALVCLPFWNGTASAMAGQLRGAKTIQIVVEDLNDEATNCGLNRKSIKAAADFPISFTKLKEVTGGSQDLELYINVLTMEIKTNSTNTFACVSTIVVEVFFRNFVVIPFNEKEQYTKVRLFHERGLYSSNPLEHGELIIDSVEKYMKLFATEFNNDNK